MRQASTEDVWDDVASTRFSGARVMVVDDDDEMRALVAERLEAEGYEVHSAASGNELLRTLALIALDRGPMDGVDLIVVDNKMPGITGLETIRQLRAEEWKTPTILITAFPEPALEQEAAMLDVPLLPKPFSLHLLTSAVLLTLLSNRIRPS